MFLEGIVKQFIKPVEVKPEPKPEPKPQPQPADVETKKATANFVGTTNRVKLEKQLAAKPTPSSALADIEKLPKPDTTDTAAVTAYKTKRAEIADNAIKNSQPPKFEDFLKSGLNGATASYEYDQAATAYNSQISQLKAVSDEAKRNPKTIVSVGEAVQKIEALPKPDYTNPKSVLDYNNKRAAIAKDALMYAKPPKIEDFRNSGLNGRTAEFEYGEAKANYDAAVKELKKDISFENSPNFLTSKGEADVKNSVEKVSKELESLGGDYEATNKKIADEISKLKLEHGDEAAAKFMADLYKKNPRELFVSLRLADKMSDYDKQNIGKALGEGYNQLSKEEKANFAKGIAEWTVGDSFTTNVNFGKSTTLAELLSHSSNTQMKTAVVKSLMEKAATIKPKAFGDNGGVDVQALFKSAAIIADTAPPAERAAMLKNIIETLPKVNLPSLIKDNETKDLLSKLFMNSGPELLHQIAPEGAMSKDEKDALVSFMELTMFSKGENSLRPKMMEYMVKLMKDAGDAAEIPPIANKEYAAKHGGWSREAHVEVMGGMFAVLAKAAENQKGAIEADQKKKEDTVKMFVGIAFSFVPGAGKVIGEVGGEGAIFLEKVAGKVADFAWDKAKDAAQSGVEDQINKLMSDDSLKNIDVMLSTLTSTASSLNESLPNGSGLDGNGKPDGSGSVNLRVIFEAAFAYYKAI